MEKPPIVNCHTHTFTGDSVPPWLAKTFVPWPFYYLLPLSGVVKILRWWYDHPYRIQFTAGFKKMQRWLYNTRMLLQRSFILMILKTIAGWFLTINIFFFVYDWLYDISGNTAVTAESTVLKIRAWLEAHHVLLTRTAFSVKLLFILLLILFFEPGRKMIMLALKYLFKFLALIPGKHTVELIKRYILIGRFSRYKTQEGIYRKLAAQYPKDTGIVVLPMDMEYMGAGKLNKNYRLKYQLEDLAEIKVRHPRTFFPFVAADPRRIKEDPSYFSYSLDANNKIILSPDCVIKKYLEDSEFNGIKLYPALGYFPFDKDLLALFKYATERGIPVTTHCIRGTIFYRGQKKKEWDKHLVFEQSMGKEAAHTDQEEDQENVEKTDVTSYCPMLLPETDNVDFQSNFTHPLNYLCLLNEELLRKVVEAYNDESINKLFGYNGPDKAMDSDLSTLKLCLAHFGGDDEWLRFMESDRDNYSSQLVKHPDRGLEFLYNNNGPNKIKRRGKPEQIWKYADWYTIICSLMLQYDNVYADISYILHQPEIMPLLKTTLQNPKLRKKVLYGTDFYVVRNHKSDKDLLAEMTAGLSEEDFDAIARYNPEEFLKTTR